MTAFAPTSMATSGAGPGFGGDGVDGVHVYAPDGTKIGQIVMPEGTANLCFVGKQRNRLFMTSSQSVYTRHRGAGRPLCLTRYYAASRRAQAFRPAFRRAAGQTESTRIQSPYNPPHMALNPGAGSGRMRLSARSVQAAWARCIARAIRGSAAMSR